MCTFCLHLLHANITRQPSAARSSPPGFANQSGRGIFVIWKRLVDDSETPSSNPSFETIRTTKLSKPLEPLKFGLKLTSAMKLMKGAIADGSYPNDAASLERLFCEVMVMQNVRRAVRWDDWTLGSQGILVKLKDGRQRMIFPFRAPERKWTKAQAFLYLCKSLDIPLDEITEKSTKEEIAEFCARNAIDIFTFGMSSSTVGYTEAIKTFSAATPRILLTWRNLLIVAAIILGMLALRWAEEEYDVEYDSFITNYAALGLDESASLQDVKRAYRRLSVTHHPDKVSNCDKQCQEAWLKISRAHQQIVDYDAGILKLVKKSSPSSSSSSSSSSSRP